MPASGEIVAQRRPDRFRHQREMAVIGMIEAEENLRAAVAERRDLRLAQTEMHELHRGSLVVLAARILAVALGRAADLLAGDAEQHVVLDAAEALERGLAAGLVVDLDHDGGDQLVAPGDERVIRPELVRDLLLPAFLDVEHLVDLMPHRRIALEIERREGSDLDTARALHRRDALAP